MLCAWPVCHCSTPPVIYSCCCIAFCPLQVSSFITPSGLKLSRQAGQRKGMVKDKVPFFLAEHWNWCVGTAARSWHWQGFVAGSAAALRACLTALTSRMNASHPTGAAPSMPRDKQQACHHRAHAVVRSVRA